MKKIILLSALLSLTGSALEIRRLEMYAYMKYQDETGTCKTMRGGGKFRFTAEIENGEVTRAVVSNHPYEFPYTHIYKSFEIVAGKANPIELYRDEKGVYWLKRWAVSEGQLAWLLYHPHRGETCESPQQFSKVRPQGVVYEFDTDDINEGLLLSYSQRLPLEGNRIDGKPFEASLQILQKQPWEDYYGYFGGSR